MGPRAVKAFMSVPISSGAWKLGTRRMPQFGNSLLPNCRRVARGYWPKKSQFYRARWVDREICDICRSGLDQEMSQVYRPGCNRYPDPATGWGIGAQPVADGANADTSPTNNFA